VSSSYKAGLAVCIAIIVGLSAMVYITYQSRLNEIESLKGQVNSLTTEKTSLQSQVNSLTTEKSSLQSQIDSLKADKTNLQKEINTLNNRIVDLQDKGNSLNAQITNLKSEVDVLTTERDNLQTQVKSLQTEKEDLQSQVDSLRALLSAYHIVENIEILWSVCSKVSDSSGNVYWRIAFALENSGNVATTFSKVVINDIEVKRYNGDANLIGGTSTSMPKGEIINAGEIKTYNIYIDDQYPTSATPYTSESTAFVKFHSAIGTDYGKLIELA